MKRLIKKFSFVAIATVLPFASIAQAAPQSATYQMIFVPRWTLASHPFEYPNVPKKQQGNFSGLIGATHKENYAIFAKGKMPTPGLENLSEHGKHSPLNGEIQAAIKAGKAGTIIETTEAIYGPIHKPVSKIFTTTKNFPLVSIVAMVVPSPDWFVGVTNVRLFSNGKWVPTVMQTATHESRLAAPREDVLRKICSTTLPIFSRR